MNSNNPEIAKWKPGVPKSVLLLIAGILWIGVGIVLDAFSYSWLRTERPDYALFATVFGFVCALFLHHFGFLRLVDKNLRRILSMQGTRCVFSFMPWKNYVLVIIMIFMGVLLRHSPIPKLYLAVLYTAIGTALILSSIRYLRYMLLLVRDH